MVDTLDVEVGGSFSELLDSGVRRNDGVVQFLA